MTDPIYNADDVDVTKYVAKLKLMMKLAENAGTEGEAEAAQAKAFEFMQRYGLTAAMVAKTESTKTEERKCVVIDTFGIYARQLRNLACGVSYAVAGSYPLVAGKNSRQYVYVYGYESATYTVQVLYSSLAMQAQSALKIAWADALKVRPRLKSATAMEKFVWKRTFLIGFTNTVIDRLNAARKRTVQASEDAGIAGAELALIDRDKQVELWATTFSKGHVKTTGLTSYSYDGLSAGQSAGQSADLGSDSGVTGSSARQLT